MTKRIADLTYVKMVANRNIVALVPGSATMAACVVNGMEAYTISATRCLNPQRHEKQSPQLCGFHRFEMKRNDAYRLVNLINEGREAYDTHYAGGGCRSGHPCGIDEHDMVTFGADPSD